MGAKVVGLSSVELLGTPVNGNRGGNTKQMELRLRALSSASRQRLRGEAWKKVERLGKR